MEENYFLFFSDVCVPRNRFISRYFARGERLRNDKHTHTHLNRTYLWVPDVIKHRKAILFFLL